MEDMRNNLNKAEMEIHQDEVKLELLKYYKTSLIIGLLKQPDAPISIENRALLAIYKYDGDIPLGLDHIRNIDTNYHERLAISKYVESRILEQVRPFVEKAKRFTGGNLEQLAASQYQKQYDNLHNDVERQQLLKNLALLKVRKLQLMKACAEIRTGPYQRNNVDLKHVEARYLQTKSELLQKLSTNEILSCTSHTVKAIKDVKTNINSLLGNSD
ncbi:augmin complex subunit dgt2 [Anopheles nili]|uniref:augmin complex subunit dgt2 n=1 Tax=Anopheles nili TaxID=185578 RepID=UPI00237BFB45|nr:augmin complex subunit dgt2 [Anopheles nili]